MSEIEMWSREQVVEAVRRAEGKAGTGPRWLAEDTVLALAATIEALNAALVKVERARARQARALKWYANKKNWSEDDWGCLAVVDPPDYADAGGKARRCLAATQKAADAAVAKVKKEGWCGDE